MAIIGIAATLIAYAISPSVRHVVSHAEHSVSNVFDHDHAKSKTSTTKTSTAP